MHGVFPASLATASKSAGAEKVKEATFLDRFFNKLTPEQAKALAFLAAGTAILSGVLLVVYYSKCGDVTREGLKPGQISSKVKKSRRSTSNSIRKTSESSRRGSKRK